MKILKYVESAWIIAAVFSFIVGIVNLIMLKTITNLVYFPIICAGFCLLIWFNIRGQRKFREKAFGETEDGKPLDSR